MTYYEAKERLGRKTRSAKFEKDKFVGLIKRPTYIEIETAIFDETFQVPITIVAIFPSNKVKTTRNEVVDLTL